MVHIHLCLRDPLEGVLHQGQPARRARRHLDPVQAANQKLIQAANQNQNHNLIQPANLNHNLELYCH